jgi:uncharacterized membrane protein
MSQELNVNQAPVTQAPQFENAEPQKPTVYLDGVDTYKNLVDGFRGELTRLLEDGYMSQGVAEKILNEFYYNAFGQTVKVNFA